jgi:hypothetical protein
MGDVNRFSEQLIDLAERFADVVDAAQGHGHRKAGPGAKWLVLPAAGAAAYALATSSSSLAKRTRGLMQQAKDRATDLPDSDLFDRVKDVTGVGEDGSSSKTQSSSGRSRTTQKRRSGSTRTQSRRKTTSTR